MNTKISIKNSRGIFSRDILPKKIKQEVGIINLDYKDGPGTYWVCYRNIEPNYCEYFDPFGLEMPEEVDTYLSQGLRPQIPPVWGFKGVSPLIYYSGYEIQLRTSVGYSCIYYLNKREKGKTILKTIHNPNFDLNGQRVNNKYIKNYFSEGFTLINRHRRCGGRSPLL